MMDGVKRRQDPRSWPRWPWSMLMTVMIVPGLCLLGLLLGHASANSRAVRDLKTTGTQQDQQAARHLPFLSFPNLFFWNLKQATEEIALQQAAVLRIPSDQVTTTFSKFEPITEALGITSSVKGFNAAWEGFWLRNAQTCLADDEDRLRQAVASAGCQVVLLFPGRKYDLDTQMVVNMSKTIIGSPTERPIIDAADAERAFMVMPGVSFDVRHILFYEGDGDLIRDEIRTRFGGVIYLSAGARLFAFDCLFTIQPVREAFINDTPEFIFGGDILMVGGVMTIVGCSFFAITPGFVNTVSTEIGGSVLILSGAATFSLVNFMTSQIFALNIGTGMHLTLLGGAVAMSGCTHTANLVFAAQGLCGRNIFVGGGVGVFTGIAVTDTMAFLAFYGAGLSIFVGAGLGIFTGCEITLINALSQKAGVGVAVAIGAGMGLYYGVPFAKDLGLTQFNTLGVFIYVGAGRLALIGCPFAHQNAIAAWELLGGAVFLGAGQAVFVGCAFARSLGIDFFVGLGGDIFIGAGELVYVGSKMTSNTGISVFIGQGTELYLAAGSAYIKNVTFSIHSGLHYFSKHVTGFWVSGRECEVKLSESPEEDHYLKERGIAFCEKGAEGGGEGAGGGGGGEGGGETNSTVESATVVVKGLHGEQHLGRWDETIDSSPPLLYMGANVTSCTLCGLENVQVEGPGSDVCPSSGGVEACPADVEEPVSSPTTKQAAFSTSLTVDKAGTTTTTTATTSKRSKWFGLGNRWRKLVDGDGNDHNSGGGAAAGSSSSSAQGGQFYEIPSDDGKEQKLPDAYVVIADLALTCRKDEEKGCGATIDDIQHALESVLFEGVEDARLVVTVYKSAETLMTTLGMPSAAAAAAPENDSATDASNSDCGPLEAYAAYAHATDKATFDLLKDRLNSSVNATVQSLTSTLSTQYNIAEICGAVNLTLRDNFYVPAARPDSSTASAMAAADALGTDTGFMAPLPRVWINITTPIITIGKSYEVAISYFDDGDRVALHLMSSKQDNSSSNLFFQQNSARLLHTFHSYDAIKGNETWVWKVAALNFKAIGKEDGPYFLKAFDTKEPGRFVLSQAFDLEGARAGRGQPQRRARTTTPESRSTATVTITREEQILRRLSADSPAVVRGGGGGTTSESTEQRRKGGRKRELGETLTTASTSHSTTNSGNSGSSSSIKTLANAAQGVDDVTMMATLLDMQHNKASMGEMWHALTTIPSAQKELKNVTLVKMMLDKAPVLRSSPDIQALDATDDGWSDPLKVQAAMTKAINDFIDLSVDIMQQDNGGSGKQKKATTTPTGMSNKEWPGKILESMTPEDKQLGSQVAQSGDLDALRQLMNNQAAHHFRGLTMEQLKDKGLLDEFKALFGGTPLFKDVIDDEDLWKTLGFA